MSMLSTPHPAASAEAEDEACFSVVESSDDERFDWDPSRERGRGAKEAGPIEGLNDVRSEEVVGLGREEAE